MHSRSGAEYGGHNNLHLLKSSSKLIHETMIKSQLNQ